MLLETKAFIIRLVIAFIITGVLTIALTSLTYIMGRKGYLGNLFTKVRKGTPRGIGIVPFLVLSLLIEPPYNFLIVIMGIFAFFDDIVGRRTILSGLIEIGQLSRGIGMVIVMGVGYYLVGPAAIFIALMIQPLNISDMQPGVTCSVTIIMSILTLIMGLILGVDISIPLILLIVCIAYSPLDYRGNIMLGEVGNHSFGITLGLGFSMLGGIIINGTTRLTGSSMSLGLIYTIVLFFVTVLLVAYIRRNYLKKYLAHNLGINNPYFGDYFMDVLTGGGLGDLIRKIILGKKRISINSTLLKKLGFRRLLFNPNA